MSEDIILRNDDDGHLDEVVAQNAFVHLERMTDKSFCLIVEKGARRVLIDIGAQSDVGANVYADEGASRVDPNDVELQLEALGFISIEAHEGVTRELAQTIRALQKELYKYRGEQK